ncbi:(-)-germacrene D synthase [Morella rubra]|uniref:(-)-germacrene D synthase n=1 Tax=Morella rubra TaxID=262757 RepID=A0A6A1WQ78_9ROSI|nr:(-)-germacrene D synthase [Morella rubra]KAB1227457.1 (-)-germacrene D synthase [Morella rubra]
MLSQDSTKNALPAINRSYADFVPSFWGDRFLAYESESPEPDEKIKLQVQELKEKVRRMLMAPVDKPLEKLNLIDTIQRMGVGYHFENEIEDILQELHKAPHGHEFDGDLHFISLRFRLLRQQGYFVSCDIFSKFKDSKGNFKESLLDDVQGMLSLYEATHLRVHGEDILEEALVFTATHLESMASCLSPPLARQVTHALEMPIQKGIPRLEARRYVSLFQEDTSHKEVLTFAMLDFNLLQKVHRKEIADITRWWKHIDLARKLPFIRDRMAECYFWILGVYFEPKYSLARMMLTKVIAMISAMDDIYDAYGTFEELELLTKAIERWDISAIHQLPEYMKVFYRALLDIYGEFDQQLGEERSYRVGYAKEIMKRQARSYFQEAKWLHQKYTPKLDEYIQLGAISSGYPALALTSFLGMGETISKDSFEWALSNPRVMEASAVAGRLMDDIESHKAIRFEQKRGHIASAVECYITQHCATEEEAINAFRRQITDAWMIINKECLHPTAVPKPLLMRILNLTRVLNIMYNGDDNYTQTGPLLEDSVASLLLNPVP